MRNKTREFPRWSVSDWHRGVFAPAVETWTGEHVGLRGWLVNLNRQMRYSLFGQVEAAPLRKRALVIGEPPMLYENILLIDALRPPQIPLDLMDAFASRLARTQELLNQQGKAFLVILAPNKALLYPEAAPAWARNRISDACSDYLPFIDALRRHQVPHLDSMALFREWRPHYPTLIPPHGIHWSHQGAWLAWQHAIPLINQQGILPEIPVPATEGVRLDKPTSMNDELRYQLNLFFSRHGDPIPSAYPVVSPLPPGAGAPIGALIVGDSFGLTFMDALARSGLCNSVQLWFYMKNGKSVSPAFDSHKQPCNRHVRSMDVGIATEESGIRMLADKNLVLLIVTTFNIDKFSWGFDHLVERLYGNPQALPAIFGESEVHLAD